MQTEMVNLIKEQETMLITLYAKALESRSKRGILDDPWAELAVSKIQNDFNKFKVGKKSSLILAIRAKVFDLVTEEFLRNNTCGTVINLGCGLDSRVYRVNPPKSFSWYDVDYPDVINLRKRLYPIRTNYHLVGSPLSDLEWLNEVKNDQPVLIMAEGVTMYLTEKIMKQLLNQVVDRFTSGQIIFNVFNKLLIKMMSRSTLRGTGATFNWGINTPEEVIQLEPRLEFVSSLKTSYFQGFSQLSFSDRMIARLVMDLIPILRKTQLPLVYKFPHSK